MDLLGRPPHSDGWGQHEQLRWGGTVQAAAGEATGRLVLALVSGRPAQPRLHCPLPSASCAAVVVPFVHPDPAAHVARDRIMSEGGQLTEDEAAAIRTRLESWPGVGGGGGTTGRIDAPVLA